MMSPALIALGNDLLQAASRRRYAGVSGLAPRVGAAAAAETQALPAGDSRRDEIAAWLKDLLGRTEILVRIARASQAAELRQVTFLQRYLSKQDRPPDRRLGISV
jgi:hypothetical protein